MNPSADLLRIAPPPQRSPRPPVWVEVEAQIGSPLPQDYKWLVDTYGPGSFDGFIHVFQPSVPALPIQLEHQHERSTSTLETLRDRGERIPYPTARLRPFARTDNGDTCYWLCLPEKQPDAWQVVVNEPRGTRWWHFDGGAVAFLVAVLSGEHLVEMFPDDFPDSEPTFQTYDPMP